MKEFFESLKPIQHALVTVSAWFMTNLGGISALIGVAVILFQLKVSFYSAKARKIESELKQMELDRARGGE